jgi:hypothetical protein
MNRVQQAPNVSKAIHNILWRCQQKIGSWVGSSVRATPASRATLLLQNQPRLLAADKSGCKGFRTTQVWRLFCVSA